MAFTNNLESLNVPPVERLDFSAGFVIAPADSGALIARQLGDTAVPSCFSEAGTILPHPERTNEQFVSFTDGDRTIRPAAFTETFGADIASELRRIGCTEVSTSGDRITLTLGANHFEPIGQGGVERARLSPSVSFDMTRSNNEISISNVSGVHLDFGAWTPWTSVPGVTLTQTGVRVLGIPFNVGRGPYDTVNDLMTRLGR